jgi:hypothetical protein
MYRSAAAEACSDMEPAWRASIQPFPTFSEAFLHVLRDLEAQTAHRVPEELSA